MNQVCEANRIILFCILNLKTIQNYARDNTLFYCIQFLICFQKKLLTYKKPIISVPFVPKFYKINSGNDTGHLLRNRKSIFILVGQLAKLFHTLRIFSLVVPQMVEDRDHPRPVHLDPAPHLHQQHPCHSQTTG